MVILDISVFVLFLQSWKKKTNSVLANEVTFYFTSNQFFGIGMDTNTNIFSTLLFILEFV